MQPSISHQSVIICTPAPVELDQALAIIGKDITIAHEDLWVVNSLEGDGIDAIRSLKRFFITGASHSAHKVGIILGADILNTPSQNAMLKLLEEPPSFARIYLLVTNPYRLLPTIRSRCQLFTYQTDELTSPDSPIWPLLAESSRAVRMTLFEKVLTPKLLPDQLLQLINQAKDRLIKDPNTINLYNLTVLLYGWQMCRANVNPQAISDYLALKLRSTDLAKTAK